MEGKYPSGALFYNLYDYNGNMKPCKMGCRRISFNFFATQKYKNP
jgi:hypothetical protein